MKTIADNCMTVTDTNNKKFRIQNSEFKNTGRVTQAGNVAVTRKSVKPDHQIRSPNFSEF